jgi:hypothetical protein
MIMKFKTSIRSSLLLGMIAALLVTLVWTPSPASAAEELVKSIRYENTGPVSIIVDHTKEQLKLLADVEGVNMEKDVTDDATWTSSNAAAIKVEKGLLTPLTKGTSRITAKYKGFSVTLEASADYLYKEIKLSEEDEMELDLGSSNITIDAIAVNQDGTTKDITEEATWSSSSSSVATVDKGELTLIGEGTATITVKYKGLSDSVKIRVSSPYNGLKITHNGLELTVGGESLTLTALGELKDSEAVENLTEKVEWTSSNANIVKVEKGRLTPVGAGIADITAKYLGMTAEVQVISRLPYRALLLSQKGNLNLFPASAPVPVSALVVNLDASRLNITNQAEWSTSNPFAVSVSQGVVTAKDLGEATVTVKYMGLTNRFQVKVFPIFTEVKLEQSEISLFTNEVKNLPKALGTTLAEESFDYSGIAEWTTDNSEIAKVEAGKLVAGKSGTATLKARINGRELPLVVTVKEKVLMLEASTRQYSLVAGDESELPVVKAIMEDGSIETVTEKVEWKTSSPALLVKSTGMKALISGKATLTGTYLNKTLTIPVTIEQKLVKLDYEPATLELNPNQSKTIRVTGTFADEKKVSLASKMEWTTSNDHVASIKGSSVKAGALGTAVVKGRYQDKEVSIIVNVVPKLLRLELSNTSLQMNSGAAATVSLFAVYSNGEVKEVTDQAVWTSSAVLIAKASNGKIAAVKKGSASIKATYNGKSATVRVKVIK